MYHALRIMYNIDTDLLFPPRVIPTLRELRGKAWQNLVDRVLLLEPTDVERMAFVLLMIRLGNCVSCHADSFRALRGCTLCATQTVRRFRGSDQELLALFSEACQEIERYLGKGEAGDQVEKTDSGDDVNRSERSDNFNHSGRNRRGNANRSLKQYPYTQKNR